ncbi:RNA polymerase sigma factor [Agreia sp. COWG]|uniref:RNA polymerase sigma factor n=1 Tax=Agreia sp. COWG TaxID=2773266 RepID=UPI0019278A48|nr:RNA polymerase sigma factor [Agreia sp. COWG]CAD5994521.1 conserved protein of unknown function [Agreia sp. COWG]
MRRRPITSEQRAWVESVVEDQADDLLRYLRRRVNQPEDAADLLGQVLLTVWAGADRVPATAQDARMWCFGIARNVSRESYRHAAKKLALADELRDDLRLTAGEDNSAAIVAEAGLRAENVRRAVGTLDERSRELIRLVHWDGFSIAEAARLMAMNESTARTRYGRALRRIEGQLHNVPANTGRRDPASVQDRPNPALDGGQ